MVVGSWWLVVGGWWLVVGGWWLLGGAPGRRLPHVDALSRSLPQATPSPRKGAKAQVAGRGPATHE
ncbi:MAG: hypothetical protein EHM55_14795 [Acidobacteria bacterium]|nr:MAG: hypothetical protein EHM55_14795 [Acidobacteriota bacterium]